MVPQAIPKDLASATQLVTGRCRYLGFVANGTADDVADVTLWDGIGAAGRRLDFINFSTIERDRAWYGPQGILCEAGIYCGTITGAISGIVYYVPQESLEGLVLVDISGSQRVIVDMHNQVDIDAAFAAINQASA